MCSWFELPVREDPVGFWLGRVAVGSRRSYGNRLKLFLEWLRLRPSWVGVDGRTLLLRQLDAKDPYEILDLLQEYVQGLEDTANYKKGVYTAVRSFFTHNRCALPQDRGFKVRASKAPVVPKLTVENVCDMVKAANLRDRSVILVKWMSMQDIERTVQIGRDCAEQIVSQMRKGIHPVRIDIPGRKNNNDPYYTFIGKDAVDALVEYFEKERGWPKPREPIWLAKGKVALSNYAFSWLWLQLARRVGLVPKRKGKRGVRYGYGTHDTRDVAKSLLHTHALKDGFDMDVSKFMMGHGSDEHNYDKFYNDQEYVRNQYLIAEPYLNILSGTPTGLSGEEVEKMRRIETEMAELKKTLALLQETMKRE